MNDPDVPPDCRTQKDSSSFAYELVPGRLSPERITEYCSRLVLPGPGRPVLSLTGGEPLLHLAFLQCWLPQAKETFSIYLETSGIHHRAMENIRKMIDVVSMDFKLPSATGMKPFWDEHKKFLIAARGTLLFVKVVVTADTGKDEILRSSSLLAEHDAEIPLIIQPATGSLAPQPSLLIEFQNIALGKLKDARIIPQAHKILKVP